MTLASDQVNDRLRGGLDPALALFDGPDQEGRVLAVTVRRVDQTGAVLVDDAALVGCAGDAKLLGEVGRAEGDGVDALHPDDLVDVAE